MASVGDPRVEETSASSFLDSPPAPLRSRVTTLQDIQNEQAVIRAQLSKETLELEKKYWLQYEPFFQKRFEIVTGHVHPSRDTQPGIPDFWLTAMKNHPDIGTMIDEDRDEPALRYITNIRVEHLAGFDFALAFFFAPNEFFSNLVICTVFRYQHEFVGERPDPLQATGDKIDWRPGRDLTGKVADDTHNTGKKQEGEDEEDDQADSFFTFLSPLSVPPEEGEDGRNEQEEQLAFDFEVAEQFKNELIPRAVDWYTGIAADDEYFGESDDSEGGNDDDDDDSDENEDDSDDFDDDEEEEEYQYNDTAHAQDRQRR